MRIKISQVEFRNFYKSFTSLFARFFNRSKNPFVYVAIGDSTVEGVGASQKEYSFASRIHSSLQSVFRDPEYFNFGKGGATIGDVLEHQIEKAIAANPDLIVISVGANDIFRKNVSPKRFRNQFDRMLRRLKTETHALIVVHNIPDFTMTRHVPVYARPGVRFWVKWFNGVIQKATEKVEGVFVDVYTQTKQIHGIEGLISSDGLHPNDRGYAIWGDFVFTIIQPYVTRLR